MANDFGLAAVTDSLKQQNDLMRKRQEEQLQQQARKAQVDQEKARIAASSARVTQGLVDSLAPLATTLDNTEKARVEVEQLRASNNPLDFLDLIGKQVTNPQMYTRAGRSKTLAEASQAANIRTQMASTQQAALSDLSQSLDANLAASGASLTSATMAEQQNAELIQAEIARVQTVTATLQSNQQMQDQRLAMMSEEEVRAAHAASGGKPIDIGGIVFAPGVLESRMVTLNERKHVRESRALAESNNKKELAKYLANKELESMNVEELRPMLLNGDSRYELADIKKVYDTKMGAQSEQLTRLSNEFQMQDFGARVTVPALQDIERMAPSIPKNTPLGHAFEAHRNTVGTITAASKTLFTDNNLPIPVEFSMTAFESIKQSQEALDKAIDKEATLRSAGNKDLKTIYTEIYRGNPAPQEAVETFARERLEKGEPLTAIFPAPVASAVTERFNSIYGAKMAASQGQLNVDKKQIKEEAIQQAITEGVGREITQRTQELFTIQLDDPTNPLYGSVSKNSFLGMVARADAEGDQAFMRAHGLSTDQLRDFKNGRPVEGLSDENSVELGLLQNQALFMQMDAVEVGLGRRYAEWWETQGPQFINKVSEGRQAQAKQQGLQAMTMETFAGTMERNQQAAYMQSLSDAVDSYDDAKASRYQQMISFDQNPGHRQAMLLNFDTTLTDSEKTLFYTKVIQPIIEEGKRQKLDYPEVNILVERAIDSGSTDDPEVTKVMRKVAKNRENELKKMDAMMDRPWWRSVGMALTPFKDPLERGWEQRVTSSEPYNWYKKIIGAPERGRPE
jgi:hypothetical protein